MTAYAINPLTVQAHVQKALGARDVWGIQQARVSRVFGKQRLYAGKLLQHLAVAAIGRAQLKQRVAKLRPRPGQEASPSPVRNSSIIASWRATCTAGSSWGPG